MNFEIAPKSSEIRLNWDDARLYCFSLNIDGKTDWRLPTIEELNEIYHSETDFVETYYWSGTEYDSNHSWFQGLGYGAQYAGDKSHFNWVRAIRSTV